MSRETAGANYRGRYTKPVPTSNLQIDDDDFPEFEQFDDDDGTEATPRTYPSSGASLSVQKVDMLQLINKPNHATSDYDTPNLVVRRGQEFFISVTFSRPPAPGDSYQLEFLIGSQPSVSKGSQIVVTFDSPQGGPWTGRIVESQGAVMMLGVTATPDAIVGKFRTYVAVKVGGSALQRTSRDTSTDMYMLFNAWCPGDVVFLPDENERREYVLNDYGVIFQGSVGSVVHRSWMYGQFERGILDACIQILDTSMMPISDRGDVIKLIRKGSAMMNSQDDNGVLVGNWSEDFSMGTAPTTWTGSTKILLQFAATHVPVSYAQCWVYAGVFNTFLRCLGLPARVVTNFSSAHDNTGNLKTDLIFKPDGTPDERNTQDSVWNYHCWNEVCMHRKDLPPNLGGWQVVDATPQETSDGHFRCGPASVAAIKDGLLCHPFDCGFVFAEVNSDVVFQIQDRYGKLTPFRVDKTHIGQSVCTKAVGGSGLIDITHTYKYPQDSPQDQLTMSRAEDYGCVRDHSELPDPQLSVTVSAEQCILGQDIKLMLDFQNPGDVPRSLRALLSGAVVFYTGVSSNHFKRQRFDVTVAPQHTERVLMHVKAEEYMRHLGSQLSLHFVVTGQSDGQSISGIKVVNLLTPQLSVAVYGQSRVNQQMFLTVSFTNPFNFPLNNTTLIMDGPRLMGIRTHLFRVIEPHASVSWTEMVVPQLSGLRRVFALLDCRNLNQVWGVADFHVLD